MAKKTGGTSGTPSAAEILKRSAAERVQYVQLQFTDLNGLLKGVTIPVSKLAGALEDGLWFDGSSIEGLTRTFESDMYLKLDPDTFSLIPWTRTGNQPIVARVICDV